MASRCYPCGLNFPRDELRLLFDTFHKRRRWVLVCEDCLGDWNRGDGTDRFFHDTTGFMPAEVGDDADGI